MNRFLGNQVKIFRAQMDPAHSIYNLFNVAFATSKVMLKEHFRCVGPIIEYSKREFYNHELRPLRLSKASERLDPPLVDVLIEDGYRKGDLNLPEARFIVGEIKRIAEDPNMRHRSVGVVSLLADKQALEIWNLLTNEIGPEAMERHRIACGDARTFQGKERDIMFLSMVVDPKDCKANTARGFEQRFNVAASRARDRMYLVRSVETEDLSPADGLRRGLISHFAAPFAQDEARVANLRELCESDFEREMYDELSQRGYWITPQVRVGHYRIDMVVEGHNDARLAIECDGDKYHGVDKWPADMQRQRVLERAGWVFWRCFASAFTRRRKEVLEDLLKTLAQRGIEPIGAEGAPRSIHTEHRRVNFSTRREDEKPVAFQLAQEIQEAPNAPPPSPPRPPGPPTATNVNPRLERVLNTDVLKLQSSVLGRAGNTPALPWAPTPEGRREALPNIPSASGPSDKAVADFCQQHGIELKDHRAKGGALWVLYLGTGDEQARQLLRWGFKWAENKGYWKK
jgi:very-short-patch-repair endonuclease